MPALNEIIGPLDADQPRPLYCQLRMALRDAIQNRVWGPDDTLPAERDLADAFAVSRITVRKALDGLVGDGLLARRQGAGTFVVGARAEKSFSKLTSFSEDMLTRGRKPHSEWLSKSRGAVSPEDCLILGVSPGSMVYRFERIRFADKVPIAIEQSTVPTHCLPSLDSVGASLYAALEKTSARPIRALQRLRAVSFGPEHAELLGVQPGDAGLLIERCGYMKNARPVEITRSWYRGDAYDFVAELSTGE